MSKATDNDCFRTEEDMSDEPADADAWTKERDRMLDEIAARLDPAYVDLVACLKPILDENMRLREALTKIADAGTFGCRIGATNEFPRGKHRDDDEGGLQAAMYVRDKTLFIEFGKPVAWLAMSREEAMAFGEALTKIADAGTFGYEARNIALEALRKTAND